MQRDDLRARVTGFGWSMSRRRAVGRLVGGVAGLATGVTAIRASAQDSPLEPGATPIVAIQPTLVGSWIVTVAFDGTPALVLPNLVTCAADGTLTVAAPTRLPELPGSDPKADYFSGGHGVWSETAGGGNLRFAFLVSDDTGTLASINTTRASVGFVPGGNTYRGTFTLDVVALNGSTTTSTGTLDGTRITIDDTAPVRMPAG